ncbi:MAG: helix-turn-helix transcriptional regulator [Methanobrevibacter boviskoreani]|jgi:putative transcriptional regulator|uniref:helix-turn-helix transcriptional regulator n=1 Tax=Methanobrevibacter TaxID=2172 RepID=UPI00033486B7|nr:MULTISPECIES: helix-turn-helix transcriptional regulator [Methanobrevibacter]AGN15995.1 HTH domain-containing protein [Methanobrevibacter sp. AbM4]MCI6774202.1 helix-turn-helix transcriptional regulator [Methanobrevibacter boviskoreani]MCI6930777.1 helix-turn-helix transcriptional regulator [Methanobrevibacter boviskoreani]MDD6257091.1 helix-turn-helix transcriptional regulator [Methanobrevibacter boviskoreani]MDY5613693.1 helix-turn-helix transcriptional regulator [Methanobrevibacter bovis
MKTEIKVLRKELNLSQQDLADQVGVSRQTINALENNRYNPSLLVAYKISKVLGCEHIEDVFKIDE